MVRGDSLTSFFWGSSEFFRDEVPFDVEESDRVGIAEDGVDERKLRRVSWKTRVGLCNRVRGTWTSHGTSCLRFKW